MTLQLNDVFMLLTWALLGAYLGGFVYRMGGADEAPGGTQLARAMWRCEPFTVLACAALLVKYPLSPTLFVANWLWLMLFLGLLILPHGAFQGLAKQPVRLDKLPARIVFQWLGLPYTRGVCVAVLGLIGIGRAAMALTAFVALPYVSYGAPMEWRWLIAAPFGMFHGLAYSWGWKFKTWFEFIERGNEWAEYIWGSFLGALIGLCCGVVLLF